jgi:hypothetical protein
VKLLILQLIIIGFVTTTFADDEQNISIATNQLAEVKQKLEAFDKGTISLDEITIDRNEEWGRALLTYYLSDTNAVTTKMKLPISRCFAGFGKYPEALQLAQDYVTVYSNDWHGWRILGGANYLLGHFNASVNAYTNAVRLGDDGSCAKLAIAAMKTDQNDLFVKAVEGVNPHDILAHDDLTDMVSQGCKQFKGEDIDKIRQEMKSATGSTNSVSGPSR